MAYNWCMPGTEKIVIHCDGACSGNQYRTNTGGWGAILQQGRRVKEIHGGEQNTTNQRMELTACIRALEQLKSGKYDVEVYTDSAYLVNCMQKNGTRPGSETVGIMPPGNRWKTATSGRSSSH